MVSDRRPLSFSKTDNTRYENFKSGTGIPSKMDVTDEYLVVFRLFSYGILGVLRLQLRHTQTIVRAFSIEIEVLLPKCKVYNFYVDTFIHF